MAQRNSWPLGLDMVASLEQGHHTPPRQNDTQQQYQGIQQNSPTFIQDWPIQQQQFTHSNDMMASQFNAFGPSLEQQTVQQSPVQYDIPTTQASLEASLQMNAPFNSLEQSPEVQTMQWNMGLANWQDFQSAQMFIGMNDGLPRVGQQSLASNSPTGTYLEINSLPSSSSDHGWNMVDNYRDMGGFQQQAHTAAIFNPGQTLHLRSHSDSSHSDGSGSFPEAIFGSFEEVSFQPFGSPYSPGSDNYVDATAHRNCFHGDAQHHHVHDVHDVHEIVDTISPAAAVAPVAIKQPVARQVASGSGSTSPPARRNSAGNGKKSPTGKSTKAVIRRTSNGKKDVVEKKVGRRKGPLLPEQRKQAGEIRKLRACLRCKFLKKTCDKGEPCAGCQPSHARLWQVPCTRIDIKDIAYFLKDWKADYERHVGRGVTVYNIKGFSEKEELMWITHGYGFAIPLKVREVYVTDDSCFMLDWTESAHDEPIEFDVKTEKMSTGSEGVSKEALDEYLDQHIDGPFEYFVDNYFEGTPFITEILKTAHRYYKKSGLPVIRKALKLVLAYNLTLHVTMIQFQGEDPNLEGKIDDEESKFFGKTFAPVMINFQIKCTLADMWRELQQDVLAELSALYSSVYSGDRLKNWPTIFMLASILLAVWEEMQFDAHYRTPDPATVDKFCTDMEVTPVGVIVGLFHAISQKLPAFTEWETRKHGQLLNNNPAVCDAMTEMREHITKHGKLDI
jgi:hypothetical protein